MSTKQARGTKRTCQSNECGVRFYDLDRKPVHCPICGSIYEIASSPMTATAVVEEKARKPKKPEFAPDKEQAPDAAAEGDGDGDEALAEIEGTDDVEVADAGEDETFLEEEEEGGNVTTIIGGTVKEGEEET